ncbi:MAG: TrkH family potassium uptake protein [Thermoprotei archaeon]|nr:MAG: TrkH family potassium uptake protein [Thermoprotei archaeon]
MNWRGIIKALGSLNGILGILMLTVPITDVALGSPVSFPFLYASIILILIGIFSSGIEAKPLSLIDSLVVVAIAWPMISIEGAIVLMYTIDIPFIDALFESVSGFTGTGFTVLKGLDYMKPSINFWRSLMQWSGELGFVVFAMVIFPYFYRIGRAVYGLERPVKIETSFYKTAVSLIKIYITLTLIGLVSYVYTGMTFYEAVNHILTTIATGGMSTYDAGYQVIFDRAPLTYIPVMIFMFIGGMNFYLIAKAFKGEWDALIKSEEFKAYWSSMLILVIATTFSYIFVEKYDVTYSLIAAPFNLISGMTTTGYSIGSLAVLKDTTKVIITISMFIGGMMFSTAGGIKSIRLLIAAKKFKDIVVRSIFSAPVERYITVDGNIVDSEDIMSALTFILMHGTIILTGALLMTVYGYSFVDTLFEATSAAGCVGLSVGIVGPQAPFGVKVVIIFLMLLGRLEYAQLILVLSLIYSRKMLRMLY